MVLYSDLQQYCLKPNVITYSVAIGACSKCSGKGQQSERATSWLVNMQHQRLEPNLISYNAVLSAFGQCQQWQQALGLEPTVISYSAAISACEKGHERNGAFS